MQSSGLVRALRLALMLLVALFAAGGARADFRRADEALARKDYAAVLASCSEDARRGEKNCQNHLGNLYRFGLGVPRDDAQALRWLQASAAQQQPYAQEALGQLYRRGQGVPLDLDKAVALISASAAQGVPAGLNALGAMNALGEGVPRDMKKACDLYEQAATKGHPWAQANFGFCLKEGSGGRKVDADGALGMARRSSATGNAAGLRLLGTLYRDGVGVPRDLNEARGLFERSIREGGDREAYTSMGYLYYLDAGARDWKVAVGYLETGAAAGSSPSARLLGDIYRLGDASVPRDGARALAAYQLSEKLRPNSGARLGLGLLFLSGIGVEANHPLARKHFESAIALGNAEARVHLAQMMEQGRGGPSDPAAASKLYKEALASPSLSPPMRAIAQEGISRGGRPTGSVQAVGTPSPAASQAAAPTAPGAAPMVSAARAGAKFRKALVLGNDRYEGVPVLTNAVADARAMSRTLESVGYQVWMHLDVSEKRFKQVLREFRLQIQGGDEVVFFYAGHGVQLGAANYLLPVDIRGDSEEQVRDEAIALQRILDDLQERKAGFTLAIIDACRDNPFKGSGRALGGRGLAAPSAVTGQMVMFSAGSGQQALDRLDQSDKTPNGLFTRILLREMVKPGVPVDRVLRNVRNEVVRLARSVGHEQTPALYDQAVGDFFFLQ